MTSPPPGAPSFRRLLAWLAAGVGLCACRARRLGFDVDRLER